MSEENNTKKSDSRVDDDGGDKSHLIDKLEATGQVIIGELELIGGALTGDPMTQAEGEFNIETGAIEAEMASSLAESESDEVDEESQP